MRHCRRLFAKLKNLFGRGRAEREMSREVSAHLTLLEDEFARRGMSAEEARMEARRAYGGVEQVKQLHREERSILWLEQTFADLRFAARSLLKSPGFAAVAVLTLALGIGANIAIFSVVDAVLLRPLPFQDPQRLVRVFDDLNGAGAKDVGMSEPELEDLRDRAGVFEDISVIFPASTALSGGDHAERIEMLGTGFDYFRILGAQPALGRVYGPRDAVPGFTESVVISDGLWKRQFGGDPHILGRRRLQSQSVPIADRTFGAPAARRLGTVETRLDHSAGSATFGRAGRATCSDLSEGLSGRVPMVLAAGTS